METPEPVNVTLKFLDWQELYEIEKPFQIFIDIPPDAKDQRNTNLVFKDVDITLTDIRGLENHFSLDQQAFKICNHVSAVMDFRNRTIVEEVYLPEVEALLRREVEEVGKVFFFDWRLRNTLPELAEEVIDLNDLTNWLRPAMHVHVDQSPTAVLNRVKLQFKEEAPKLLKSRVRIINVWRPLVNAVEDWPLAICDGSTIDRNDLIETDHVRRHYTGSTMYLKHNSEQRFYYMSQQTKNEPLIFKNFDSKKSIPGKCAPHASFHHPNPRKDYEPRQSIEVRALVFSTNE